MDMKIWTPFLLPLALVYGGITALRNYFFEWEIFDQNSNLILSNQQFK